MIPVIAQPPIMRGSVCEIRTENISVKKEPVNTGNLGSSIESPSPQSEVLRCYPRGADKEPVFFSFRVSRGLAKVGRVSRWQTNDEDAQSEDTVR